MTRASSISDQLTSLLIIQMHQMLLTMPTAILITAMALS